MKFIPFNFSSEEVHITKAQNQIDKSSNHNFLYKIEFTESKLLFTKINFARTNFPFPQIEAQLYLEFCDSWP